MTHTSVAMFERNPRTAGIIEEILGLPEGTAWSEIRCEFGYDNFGTVTLTIIPTGEQMLDLARVALLPLDNHLAPTDIGETPNE